MTDASTPTVVHALLAAARRAPEREALICGDIRLSYATTVARVTALAQRLRADIREHERVALIMANSPALCIALYAVQMARAQAVPLNPGYTQRELEAQLRQAQVSAVILDQEAAPDVAAAVPSAAGCLRLDPEAAVVATDDGRDSAPMPRATDPAVLQFTGGTTGSPKAASLTHAALQANLSQRAALVPARQDCERMLCVMPLFHCYAIHMCLHNMVQVGGTLVIVHPCTPETVLQTMASERITVFGGSPTLLSGLMQDERFDNTDFSSLAVTYSGSAPLPPDLLRRWESGTGSIVVEGYGQSEAGPVISFNPLSGPRKAGSVGLPLPGVATEVVDPESGTGTTLPNVAGEIRVRGPQIMSGYFGDEPATANTLRDGWLHTGDIGHFDSDGYLFVDGRSKEMILVSGYNVYPREIEDWLCSSPGVREAAVVGTAHPHRGEVPVAYVVPHRAAAVSAENLAAHCEDGLAHYKRPVAYHIVTELPKTAVGKLDRTALCRRARYAASNSN